MRFRVGTERAVEIGDAVAHLNVRYTASDRLDHAGALEPEAGWERRRHLSAANVDIDEVHTRSGVPHARLARSGFRYANRFEAQHLGTTDVVEANGIGHVRILPRADILERATPRIRPALRPVRSETQGRCD